MTERTRVAAHSLPSDEHSLEDAYVVRKLKWGLFAGVFDGHGGDAAAKLLACNAYDLFRLHDVEAALGTLHQAPRCSHCKRDEAAAKCARCNSALYCSQTCQLRDWRSHQPQCRLSLHAVDTEVDSSTVDVSPILKSLRKGYESAERILLEQKTHAGTCAVTALVGTQHVFVAHVGDCRAVLLSSSSSSSSSHGATGAKAIELTKDHRLDNAEEAERVLREGGWFEDGRVFGVLQPTRTLGDADLKLRTPMRLNRKARRKTAPAAPTPVLIQPSEAVSAVPCLNAIAIEEHHTALVLGSDGLFDKLSTAEVAALVAAHMDKAATAVPLSDNTPAEEEEGQSIAQQLCQISRARGVRDDITAVVIFF